MFISWCRPGVPLLLPLCAPMIAVISPHVGFFHTWCPEGQHSVAHSPMPAQFGQFLSMVGV